MILHCGSLFGTYFGSTTSRSNWQQSYRQRPGSEDAPPPDQNPYPAQQPTQGPRQMVSAIAGLHNQQPWGSENLSMGPGSLNSNSHAQHTQHVQQQKLMKKLSGSKPAPIDVDAMSSISSGSARSESARAGGPVARRRSGSLPSSPVRQQLGASDRGSREMPWLQGKQHGPVEKALQKNKIRCQLSCLKHNACLYHMKLPCLHMRHAMLLLLHGAPAARHFSAGSQHAAHAEPDSIIAIGDCNQDTKHKQPNDALTTCASICSS